MAAGHHAAHVQNRPDFLFPTSHGSLSSQQEIRTQAVTVFVRDTILASAATHYVIRVAIMTIIVT